MEPSELHENTKPENYLQACPPNRNRCLLATLRELRFSPANIRRGLMVLNGLNQMDITAGRISRTTLTLTIDGTRNSPTARRMLSGKLGLTVEELFE